GRRRLERGGKKSQTAVRIGRRVRPLRITPQIRPIGGRRVDNAGPPPRDRLAPGGNDGAHARSHEVVGIGGEEFRIAVQRVALQRRGIGFLRAETRIGRARIAAVCSFETAGGGASGARSKNTSEVSTFDACHGTSAPLVTSLTRSRARSKTPASGRPPSRSISASAWA